jgi:peptide/nickel transport system substrate-binding protein
LLNSFIFKEKIGGVIMKITRFLIVLGMVLLIALPVFSGGQQDEPEPMAETMMEDGVGPVNSNPLSDLRVRQAIAYAIDMETIAETLFEGMVIVADSQIPNGSWKAPGLEKYNYDPDKSRALLKAANWDSSQVLDLVFYYGDQQTIDLMTAIQAQLADVGIQMTFRKLEGDVAAQLNDLPKHPVDGPSSIVWDLGYGARAALALQEYYNAYATGISAHTPGDEKLDALIDDINGTSDVGKQQEAFFAIERYDSEMLYSLPLYYQQLFIFESTKVNRNGEMYGNAQYNYDWGITKWTVPADEKGNHVLKTNGGPIEFFQNPWFNPGIWMSTKVLFDRLITCDGSLTPTRPLMAQSYDLSADGMTLKVTLKNGLKWHDGSPLTVDDVKFSAELAYMIPTVHPVFIKTFSSLKGAQAYKDGSADEIAGITTSGNTITFELETLDPNILLTFSQFGILPEKYLGDVDPLKFQQDPFWQMPIGSGPFMVDEVEMNDYLVMVPFKDYHGGVAKIDQITCYPTFDSDPNAVKNAAAGRLDYAFSKNTAEVAAVNEMDHMRVTPVDIPYTRMIWFNKFPKP